MSRELKTTEKKTEAGALLTRAALGSTSPREPDARDLEASLRRLARDERTSPGLTRTLEQLLGWIGDTTATS